MRGSVVFGLRFPGFSVFGQIPFAMQLQTRESLNLIWETPALATVSTATSTSTSELASGFVRFLAQMTCGYASPIFEGGDL